MRIVSPQMGLLVCLLAVPAVSGQSVYEVGTGSVVAVPVVNGPNASLATSSQHESVNGWSSVFTPDVSWRFNRHFSIDATAPIYAYINIYQNTGTKARPVYAYKEHRGVVGDTALNGHYESTPAWLAYTGNVTLGLPSGNTGYGLGAGQATYNITNHLEKDLDWFTPDVEIGLGDSSALLGQQVRKSYVSVGTLANFQVGGSFDLPLKMNFDVELYEDLPLAASTIYSTTGRGVKKVTTAVGKSVAEDNGVATSLDIPLNPHITLSGFYSRSLRNRDDTAGFSLTFLARAPPKKKD